MKTRQRTSCLFYKECGLPKRIAFSKDTNLITSNLPFIKGSNEDNIFKTYQWAVNNRNSLAKRPLAEVKKTEYNLNIPDNEIIYHRINSLSLYEERTIRHNIVYSGMRWSNGLLRAGTISAIGNEVKRFCSTRFWPSFHYKQTNNICWKSKIDCVHGAFTTTLKDWVAPIDDNYLFKWFNSKDGKSATISNLLS